MVVIRQHCLSFIDDSDKSYCVAQFLRELLLYWEIGHVQQADITCWLWTEIDCIVGYLNACFNTSFALYYVYDFITR